MHQALNVLRPAPITFLQPTFFLPISTEWRKCNQQSNLSLKVIRQRPSMNKVKPQNSSRLRWETLARWQIKERVREMIKTILYNPIGNPLVLLRSKKMRILMKMFQEIHFSKKVQKITGIYWGSSSLTINILRHHLEE